RPRHARVGLVSALPDDRCELDQRTVPTVVPADLLRPARQGPGAPRAGRYPRVHPRAAVLPAHRIRAAAGARDQRYRSHRRGVGRPTPHPGGNGFARGGLDKLVSTALLRALRVTGRQRWWV